MSALTFGQLRETSVARCTAADGFNQPLAMWTRDEWLVAVNGELGEAMNVLKKLNRARDGIVGNDKPPSLLRDQFGDEVADTAIYIDLYAASEDLPLAAHGTTLSSLVQSNEIAPYLSNSPSRHMGVAFRTLASASSHLDQAAWYKDRDSARYHENRGHAGDALEASLTSLAAALRHFGIDLGAAVTRKFNATSDKLGMPHRLITLDHGRAM